ncbi:unnamed protein product [Chironomus riparius]|uniref:Uncharacterized protein n=1 Tax=Chironomus riparius TaxID=315576 RepID=A0A9N9WQ21_9DIPT|nr:unnamed protein product [Chironomus riparius]
MFKLEDLHEYACSHVNLYFNICSKFKSNVNVWRIPFKGKIMDLFFNCHDTLSCSDTFIVIYWITLILGLIGIFEACKEMIIIFNDENYEPMTFGQRSYEFIGVRQRRRARICGLSLNIKLFFGLIYGLIKLRTSHILPWIAVYGFIIAIEIFYWICDTYTNRRVKLAPIRSLVILIVRWLLTIHIMLVINAIKAKGMI